MRADLTTRVARFMLSRLSFLAEDVVDILLCRPHLGPIRYDRTPIHGLTLSLNSMKLWCCVC